MLPFRFLPDTTYLLTLRCSERRFLLKPSPEVLETFLFCLLHAAKEHDIELHAFCVLSNHYHLVVTDRTVKLPQFMAWLNSQVARCLNAHYGRWEGFWTRQPYSRQVLEDSEAILEELVYTLTNPVSSRLVQRPEQWPGLISRPEDIGGATLEAKRPRWYFRDKGPVPREASGRLTVPPAFQELGTEGFCELLRQRVEARLQELEQEFAARNVEPLGAERVLEQDWRDSPSTVAPRRQLNPRVACKDRGRRVSFLEALKRFYEDYRSALQSYRDGDTEVLFPCGTFWMRVYASVRCHAFAPT